MPDIEKLLKDISQEPPSRILAKYKEAFGLTDEAIDAASSSMSRVQTDQQLAQFDEFLKKILLRFKDIKKRVVALQESKNESMSYQRNIFASLGKYEERTFAYLQDKPDQQLQPMSRMVVGGAHNELTKDF